MVCDDRLVVTEVLARDGRRDVPSSLAVGAKWNEMYHAHINVLLGREAAACSLPAGGATPIVLPDGTGANMWVDVKLLLRKPEVAFRIAYHMAYMLTSAFWSDIQENGFAVGNNNAWLVASLLQRLYPQKELYVFDRLGPAARLSGIWALSLAEKVRGKAFVLVEDVVSSGRELDLLFLVLRLYAADARRAISIFDLEFASPVLFSESLGMIHTGLCRPSRSIGYSRLPKYAVAGRV